MAEILSALIPIIGALGGGIWGIVKGFQFVKEGERAILTRFDKAIVRKGSYKVVMPGLKLMIPGIHRLARIHVRQRTINFPLQTIVLADNTVFEISAVLICRVKDSAQDLYNALFETTGINQALTDYGLTVVRKVLGNKRHDSLFGEDREKISSELLAAITGRAGEWGVEILAFELSDCKPNEETARLIQTSAQAKFRVDALTVAAKVLGYEKPRELNPQLAAVLVGAPLVASVQANVNVEPDEQTHA